MILTRFPALLLCLCVLGCASDSPVLYDKYFSPPEALMDTIAGDFAFREGMVAFDKGEYLPALSFLMQVDPDSMNVDTVSYYIGMAEIALDNHERGLSFLEAASAITKSDLKADILWYSALTQIKLGQNTIARRTLEQLTGFSGNAYADRANTLLSELAD